MVSDVFLRALLCLLLWLYVMVAVGVAPGPPHPGPLATPAITISVPATRNHSWPHLSAHCAACAQARPERSALTGAAPADSPAAEFARGRSTLHPVLPPPPLCLLWPGGYGNLQANASQTWAPGPPMACTACQGYFLETHGTSLYSKRVGPRNWCGPWRRWRKGWASGCGPGVRSGPQYGADVGGRSHRPAPGLLAALSARRAVTQVQLDELYALLRAVRDGEVSEATALTRLARSLAGSGWRLIRSQLLLAWTSGDRTLAMAQRSSIRWAGVGARVCALFSRTASRRRLWSECVTGSFFGTLEAIHRC